MPTERRRPPKPERVIIPMDVFTRVAITTAQISDGLLNLTKVLARKAELAGSIEDMNHFEPFVMSINARLDQLQEMLRACLEESCPQTENYHG